jgi:hypothetical protein
VAHGWLFTPLYKTPMIRAFPYGFNYPIPRGWQIAPEDGQIANPLPWSEAPEEYKDLWRGARIALRVLSIKEHHISELCFDSYQLATGINYMIFDRPCEENNHFAAIMKRPGFQHLDLSLLVGYDGIYDWAGLRSGYFSQAVSLAKDLTYIYLSTTLNDGDSSGEPVVPLKETFRIEQWPKLRHFGLSRFSVSRAELIDLLNLMPSSLRSVELEFLLFPNDERRWSALLENMRDELNWTERDLSLRPTVAIVMEGYDRMPGRFAIVTDEVTNFLYGSGEIPVQGMSNRNPKFGMGTLRDLFEDDYSRPNLSVKDLAELGIIYYGNRPGGSRA